MKKIIFLFFVFTLSLSAYGQEMETPDAILSESEVTETTVESDQDLDTTSSDISREDKTENQDTANSEEKEYVYVSEADGITAEQDPVKFILFGKFFKKPESAKDFFNSLEFSLKLPVSIFFNTEDSKHSAPPPLFVMPGISVLWPNYTFIATEPSLSFYQGYYLWYEGKALPAEIENRTTTAWTFLLDIPIVVTFFFQKYKFQLTGGVSALMRFGTLSTGVSPEEPGFSGTAQSDNDLINQYFWDNARFLFLSTSFSCMFSFYNHSKAGPYVAAYFPLMGTFAGDGLNGMIISAGIKVAF
ncbi:MAG: hypothetical protein HUK25_02890 [Treponema sp.]|nr:hypothetical protein [Treponema sp.]